MKSRFIRVALFTVALAVPALMLAAGQPSKVRMITKAELQDHTFARAINQGKSAVYTRKQVAEPARSQNVRPNHSDSAFTK